MTKQSKNQPRKLKVKKNVRIILVFRSVKFVRFQCKSVVICHSNYARKLRCCNIAFIMCISALQSREAWTPQDIPNIEIS